MRKRNQAQPSDDIGLFDLFSAPEPVQETKKKRKPRQKKDAPNPVTEPVKDTSPKSKKKATTSKETAPKKPKTEFDESGWKDFNTSKPEIHIPCDFYIDTGKKRLTFRGYIQEPGVTCTDDPYKLTVLRRKYGNIKYREILGCKVEDCPEGFPCCERCKRGKCK
jgi:hypothetical protein